MMTYTKRKKRKLKKYMIRAVLIAGARPNFMKCAPLLKALGKSKKFRTLFIHTGQHYDYEMSKVFFAHLNIRKPDIFLNIGSAPRLRQIHMVRTRLAPALRRFRPDIAIVVGDVNSTLGAAIATKEAGVKLAHIEGGLRSFDKSMPEEANRIATDAISDFIFTTSESANRNLIKEKVAKTKIYFVGNVMIDTLVENLKKAERSRILKKLNVRRAAYYVLTIHRPSNVDRKKRLRGILGAVSDIAKKGGKVVFPVHPRTEKMLKKFRLFKSLKGSPFFVCTKPLGYLDFLKLLKYSRTVFTDSGGIQEETAYLNVPCLTLRKNTERPITVETGYNVIAGNTPRSIAKNYAHMERLCRAKKKRRIKFWDGKAAGRIVKILLRGVANG